MTLMGGFLEAIGGWFESPLAHLSIEFKFAEIAEATGNFAPHRVLGSGSHGAVYHAQLKDGTEAAVKRLELPEEGGFEKEVRVLSKFRHPNLVLLLGFAAQDNERYLVYEYLPGGDVSTRLTHKNPPLLWNERLQVASDASSGLCHLLCATPQAFHRDIKTPNILLDRHGIAKVADFGLAAVSATGRQHKVAGDRAGTFGYACPTYIETGVVSEASEVYSFGMVMVELLTARPPAYMGYDASGQ